MEFIFECFYEDTLDKLCRNGLQDRSSRRDVLDHLNAIIGGCSDGKCVLLLSFSFVAIFQIYF